ncbi:MAG TPA: hypothetical protein VHY34_12345 [Caulobacteraceae bacterium]|jgi:hypothetical protein|nr:hypothetical protein [Caulobacteraceae bacterium]
MSFDVFLIPSSGSPPAAHFEAEVRAAIVATGGRAPAGDGIMQTSDGAEFELFGGSMFALHGLTPSICVVIYRAAARTNAYVIPTGADGLPSLKVKGTTGVAPKGVESVKVVADPQALCAVLEQGYRGWRGFADHVHATLNPPTGPR